MYQYSIERPKLFTEEGQLAFITIRDAVHKMLREAGAFRMGNALDVGPHGDSWLRMACVDRLIELDEIVEVARGREVAGQDRIFVVARG